MSNEIYPCAYENKLTCFKTKIVDIDFENDNSELRLDLILEEKKVSKIWGYILDDEHKPIKDATINLLKPQYISKGFEYMKVDSSISNKDGFYQFEIKESYKEINYVVTVEKSD